MRLDYKKASDEVLMAAYQRGDDLAFTTLYERHRRKVQGVAFMKVGNDAIAGDIRQNVFNRLTDTRHNFDPKRSFKSWINSITKRAIAEHFRSAERKPLDLRYDREGDNAVKIDLEMSRQYTDEFTHDELSEVENQANSVFDQTSEIDDPDHGTSSGINWSALNEVQREVIELRFKKGMEYEEIAKRLNVKEANARKIVSRAVEILRKSRVSQ